MIPFDTVMKLNREYAIKQFNSQKRSRNRALRKLTAAWKTLHHKCPGPAADAFCKALCDFQESQHELESRQKAIVFHDLLTDVPAAVVGRKMFGAQEQRRKIKSEYCRDDWAKWQAWINKESQAHKWSFPFAQRQAAGHFGVSLKSMKRRTKKPGQAD